MFKSKLFDLPRSRTLLIAKAIVTASVLTLSVFTATVAQASPQSQDTARILKNDDVVSLVKAGLSDSAIIGLIGRSQTNFDVSPQALIRLKDAGVSNAVIESMVTPRAAASTPAPTSRTDSEPVNTGGCSDAATCIASGDGLLKSGKYAEAAQAWDKALELGGSLNFLVCRETGFTGCKPGTFLMSSKEVSFLDGKSQQVFSASLSDVEVKGAQKALRSMVRSSPRPFVRFKLKVSGKDYNFVFQPMNITCTDTNPPTCDEPGLSQQETVANYIARKLQSLKTD